MIEKRIEICIGTDRSKHVRARLSLLLVDGANVINEHYHSISIEPGADLTALRSGNEAHIAKPDGGVPGAPWPAIPDSEWEKVEMCCAVVHTPDVLIKASAEQTALTAEIQGKLSVLAEARALAKSESEALQTDLAELAKLRAAA
jgi:hypothetical protein